MTTCRTFEDQLVDYLDDRLPEHAYNEMSAHRAQCATCRAYLSAYEGTIDVLKAAFRPEPDAPLCDQPAFDL